MCASMSSVEAPARFVTGRVYQRAALHDEYGGQRQGGIATPKSSPIVLVFTGSSGLSFGYDDKPDEDGVFHYFGEGQTGDMTFSRGNAAIRDHSSKEKELHLFEGAGSGRVRYLGEFLCSGFKWRVAKDKAGDDRQAIIFQLVQVAGLDRDDVESLPSSSSLAELAAAADADPTEENAPKEGLRKAYARSGALKRFVRVRADGTCEACGKSAPFIGKDGVAFLEAHHTNRRSDFGPGDRRTVIALCPNCHCRVHYGRDGSTFNETLKEKLAAIEG
jgi:5-methylcytosine-specific restriction protein A